MKFASVCGYGGYEYGWWDGVWGKGEGVTSVVMTNLFAQWIYFVIW
jgi:hypothetical protein